jgi:hypothetical protein
MLDSVLAALKDSHAQALAAGREAAKEERLRTETAVREERERGAVALNGERLRADAAVVALLTQQLGAVKYELDVSRGTVRARNLFEACLLDLATKRKLTKANSSTARLKALLNSYPALVSYVRACAIDNQADADTVLEKGRSLYITLSRPMHVVEKGTTPSAVFGGPVVDMCSLIAYSAIVRFSARDPALYLKGGETVPLVFRVVPTNEEATEEEVLAGPKLPLSDVSVELLLEEMPPVDEGGLLAGGEGEGRRRGERIRMRGGLQVLQLSPIQKCAHWGGDR